MIDRYCVLACGSRDWQDELAILRALREAEIPGARMVLVHGAARGADRIAGQLARRIGWEVIAYPVTAEDWKTIGRRAGHVRNQLMLSEERPDIVLAFDLGTPGTADMIRRASKAGVPVRVFGPGG